MSRRVGPPWVRQVDHPSGTGSAVCGKVSGQGAGAPSHVLKIHVVRPGGHRYYVDELVPGRAEGTGVAGEAPGAWSGSGTVDLGVTGTVEPP